MQSVTGAGLVVAGRYQLLGRVGQGAMGTVWRAKDLVLARDVAVKEVTALALATAAERKVLQERALREARVAARLNHPGLVTVHDVIEADGGIWIVMELVASRSLARVLAEDGPLAPVRAAELGTMLIEALGCAHASGIVHRDVKPANVLIAEDGRAVLTDFGIATLNGDPRLTQAGMVMGTPGFCAPERIRGEPASPASDLWSLGATLYAAVEGHGPFESRDCPMAVLTHIVHADAPPADSAGPLLPVISVLMSRDPAERPDAAAAAQLLAEAVAAGNEAAPTEPAEPGLPGDAPATAPSPAGRARQTAGGRSPPAERHVAVPGGEALPAEGHVAMPDGEALPAEGHVAVPDGEALPAEATPIFEAVAVSFRAAQQPSPARRAPARAERGRHRRRLVKGGDVLGVLLAAVVGTAAAGMTALTLALRQSVRLATGGGPSRDPGRGHRAPR